MPHQGWRTQSALLFIHSWREINWIHTFPKVLVLCEMQSVLSRIWTCVAVSISYDDNHYTTGTSYLILIIFKQIYDTWTGIAITSQSGHRMIVSKRVTLHSLEIQNWKFTTGCRLVYYPYWRSDPSPKNAPSIF